MFKKEILYFLTFAIRGETNNTNLSETLQLAESAGAPGWVVRLGGEENQAECYIATNPPDRVIIFSGSMIWNLLQ